MNMNGHPGLFSGGLRDSTRKHVMLTNKRQQKQQHNHKTPLRTHCMRCASTHSAQLCSAIKHRLKCVLS